MGHPEKAVRETRPVSTTVVQLHERMEYLHKRRALLLHDLNDVVREMAQLDLLLSVAPSTPRIVEDDDIENLRGPLPASDKVHRV